MNTLAILRRLAPRDNGLQSQLKAQGRGFLYLAAKFLRQVHQAQEMHTNAGIQRQQDCVLLLFEKRAATSSQLAQDDPVLIHDALSADLHDVAGRSVGKRRDSCRSLPSMLLLDRAQGVSHLILV